MAKKTINIGSGELAGDGESLRSAFDKINDNFDENYASIAALEDGHISTNIQGSVFTDDSTQVIDAGTNSINLDGTVKGNIIPDRDSVYDIGSGTYRFKDLYLAGNTLDLGGLKLRYRNNGLQIAVDLVVGEPLFPPGDGVASSEWFDETGVPFFYNYDENGQIIGDLSAAANTDVCRDAEGNPTAFIQINYFKTGGLGDTVGTLDTILKLKSGNGHALVDPELFGAGLGSNASKLYGDATWPIELQHTGDPIYHPYPKFVSGPGTIPPTPQNVYEGDPDRGYIIIPVNLTPIEAGIVPANYQYASTFIYAHAFPIELQVGGGSQQTDVTDANGETLVDSEAGTLNADKLAGNVDSELLTGGLFNITGDDSTLRSVHQGNSIQFVGGTGITTTSDADGVITITGVDAYSKAEVDATIAGVTAGHFSFNVAADDSTVRAVNSGNTIQFVGGRNITTSSDVDGVITIETGNSFSGELKGSVFADDSTLLVDGVNGQIVGSVNTGVVNADIFGANTVGSFINLGVNASSVNVVTGIDMLTNDITNVGSIAGYISTADLKTLVAASADFADFQARIAAL